MRPERINANCDSIGRLGAQLRAVAGFGAAIVRSRGTSKNAISRRFVGATREKLAEMMSRDLRGLPLCTVMIDGIRVGERLVLVALGIDEHGEKHVLALSEGGTENATVCTALRQDRVACGLKTNRTTLFAIDGKQSALQGQSQRLWRPRPHPAMSGAQATQRREPLARGHEDLQPTSFAQLVAAGAVLS